MSNDEISLLGKLARYGEGSSAFKEQGDYLVRTLGAAQFRLAVDSGVGDVKEYVKGLNNPKVSIVEVNGGATRESKFRVQVKLTHEELEGFFKKQPQAKSPIDKLIEREGLSAFKYVKEKETFVIDSKTSEMHGLQISKGQFVIFAKEVLTAIFRDKGELKAKFQSPEGENQNSLVFKIPELGKALGYDWKNKLDILDLDYKIDKKGIEIKISDLDNLEIPKFIGGYKNPERKLFDDRYEVPSGLSDFEVDYLKKQGDFVVGELSGKRVSSQIKKYDLAEVRDNLGANNWHHKLKKAGVDYTIDGDTIIILKEDIRNLSMQTPSSVVKKADWDLVKSIQQQHPDF